MALRLRRGTDAERLTITPLAGELIYTTDTKRLFVGDGVTEGGNAVDSTVDLSTTSINALSDVNTSGDSTTPINGEVLAWSATNNEWRPTLLQLSGDGSVVEGSNYRINIASDDSTIMVDTVSQTFTGKLVGDVTGSVFSDDSGVIIDGINRNGSFNSISTDTVTLTGSTYISTLATPGILNDIHKFGDLGTPNSLVVFTDTRIIEANGFGNASDQAPDIEVFKARGTADSPLSVLSGDDTAKYISYAYDGTDYDTVAGFQIRVNDTVTTGNIPGEFNILVGNLINSPGDLKSFSFKGDGTLTLPGPVIGLRGDLTGSVFADDSTVMVDAVNNTLHAGTVNAIAFQGSLVSTGGANAPLQIFSGQQGQTGNTILINPYGSDTYLIHQSETYEWRTGPYLSSGNPYIQFTTAGAFEAYQGAYFVGDLTGDVTGSVFADDSTLLVDGVNGEIPGYVKIADLKTALQDGAGDYAAFKAWVLANL